MRLNVHKIKEEMKRQGLTQAAVCDRCGKSRAWLSIALKKKKTSFESVEKLAEALGVSDKSLIIGG